MRNPLLARFDAVPSIVAPELQGRFESCLHAVMASPHAAEMLSERAANDDGFWPEAGSWKASLRPYIVADGVLQIPVKGVLLHDFSFAYGTYATGYKYIQRAFQRGLADATVKGIALLCDSPGGEVAGNFDLVDMMFAARGKKPIRAFAHESAYSAAYSIASAADKIVVSRTGGVGSIGVVTAHVDVSKAMDEDGIKVTFIYAGAHKVDGNRYEALPDAVKDRIQARIDGLYDVFVSCVARNRGMNEKAIRKTEAATFSAEEAVANGLADTIGSLDDAVAAFAEDLSTDQGDDNMDEAAHLAAVAAARTEAHAEGVRVGTDAGRAEGAKTGEVSAKTRIKAILDDASAKGRDDQARAFAFDTDIPAEQAVALLAKAPLASAPPPPEKQNRLASDMERERQIDLGADGSGGAQLSDTQKGAAEAKKLLGKA